MTKYQAVVLFILGVSFGFGVVLVILDRLFPVKENGK